MSDKINRGRPLRREQKFAILDGLYGMKVNLIKRLQDLEIEIKEVEAHPEVINESEEEKK